VSGHSQPSGVSFRDRLLDLGKELRIRFQKQGNDLGQKFEIVFEQGGIKYIRGR